MAKKRPAKSAITLEDVATGVSEQKTEGHLTNFKGKPLATIENLKWLLDFHNVICRYNLISKEIELLIPNVQFSIDNAYSASFAWIASKMKEVSLPTDHYDKFLLYIADKNPYNPVREWIISKPWDGKSRIQDFQQTIQAENEEAKNAFIYRWLIGAVASACSPEGIDGQGVLVLQGKQNLGKTWWFRRLVPHEQLPNIIRTGAKITANLKDSIEQIISYWIVELGELDATFKSSDIADLKALLTQSADILRKSYAPRASVYPRRTVFGASVNEYNYLYDRSGNRRFWTVSCRAVDSYHQVDMQQLWAEIYCNWQDGEDWRMTKEESKLLEETNIGHQQIDPIYEMLLQKYSWGSSLISSWKTATDVAGEIGLKNIGQKETRIITKYVLDLNGDQRKRSNGKALLLVPAITS